MDIKLCVFNINIGFFKIVVKRVDLEFVKVEDMEKFFFVCNSLMDLNDVFDEFFDVFEFFEFDSLIDNFFFL